MSQSPYQAVLGERFDALHPSLVAYFSCIPLGSHGHGDGVFETVGTPRRWLWPVLWLLARFGIMFPVWERDVSFTVLNTPAEDARPAVSAVRTFRLATGERSMVDVIEWTGTQLVDRLGRGRILVAQFDAEVVDGSLRLASTGVGLRFASRVLPLPSWFAPRVELREEFDDSLELQRVSVVVSHPLFGRIYEYGGSFRYEIRSGEGSTA